jgi:hypothetical protein
VTDELGPDAQDPDWVEAVTFAVNAALPDLDTAATSPDALHRARQARAERYQRYARLLLHAIGPEPDRLTRLLDTCQEQAAAHQDDPDGPDPAFAAAVELTETALRDAVAADQAGPSGRDALVDELDREHSWGSAEPYRQGPWHRHSRPRRILRRASPARWWRRMRARRHLDLVDAPYGDRPLRKKISIQLDGAEVGRLWYAVCDECRLGWVAKISVHDDLQGLGLGGAALAAAAGRAPGYRWVTTGQRHSAVTFWRQLGRHTGRGYSVGDPCSHMRIGRSTPRSTSDLEL